MRDNAQVLHRILGAAEISSGACAAALGVSERILDEMASGQRQIPDSMLPLVAAVVGVGESVLTSPAKEVRGNDVLPAIWYKLRTSKGVTEVDREYVLALRQLAYYQHELEQITDKKSASWKVLFEGLRRGIDPQASPVEQGRRAARLFRSETGLDQGATGIGEVFRGHLRNIGMLVIESPAPDSVLEGCSFYVGPSNALRPALFANAYRTTWFRRNSILMHELAHAIFDVESNIAELDLIEDSEVQNIQEDRAEAFAQEALVPFEVLRHMGQKIGIRWSNIGVEELAQLISATHVEQRALVRALVDGGLVNQEAGDAIARLDVADALNKFTTHNLPTRQYMQLAGVSADWVKGRTTTASPKPLRLPLRYVSEILSALSLGGISRGKAARMLMIEEHELDERFSVELPCTED